MPSRCASSVEVGFIGSPPRARSPACSDSTPVSTLIKVDLPAPFCPISAWTSPARKLKSTPSSAGLPEYTCVMPRAVSRGAGALTSATMVGSVLALREFLRGHFHREHRLLGDDASRNLLAGGDVLHRGHELGTQQ